MAAVRTANLCCVHTSCIPRKTPSQPDDKVATTANQNKNKSEKKEKKRKSQVNAKKTLRENLSRKTKAIKKLS